MLNRVSLVGRITRDLELRKSSNNNPFVAFTLAVDSQYGDKSNVAFISCFAWNKTAENMARFLGKGSLIAVDGRLISRQQVIGGQKITMSDVVADSVSFLDRRSNADNNTSSQNNYDNTWQDTNKNSAQPNHAGMEQPSFNNAPTSNFANRNTNTMAVHNNQPTNNNDDITFDGDDAILWD